MVPASAADQGDARAQYHLGFKYATGVGVSQDYVAAYMWLNLAGAQSSGDDRKAFVKGREAVAARMTSEQIADAQWLAREWKPDGETVRLVREVIPPGTSWTQTPRRTEMDEGAPKLLSRWFALAALTLAGFGPTAFLFWPLTYNEA